MGIPPSNLGKVFMGWAVCKPPKGLGVFGVLFISFYIPIYLGPKRGFPIKRKVKRMFVNPRFKGKNGETKGGAKTYGY